MPTNREIASLIYIGAFSIWALLMPGIWSSLLRILKTLTHRAFLIVITVYLIYAFTLLLLASLLGVWDARILKDTVLIVLLVGLPSLLRATGIKRGGLLVRRTIKETMGVSAFLALYVNSVSLNIFWELILQAIAIVASVWSVFANPRGDKERQAAHGEDYILLVVGVIFLASATVGLINGWSSQDPEVVAKTLAVSIWFPLLLLPFIYLLSFYIHCESLFIHLSLFNNLRKPKWRVGLAILIGLRFSVRLVSSFIGEWRVRVASLQTFREARNVMIEFRRETKLDE